VRLDSRAQQFVDRSAVGQIASRLLRPIGNHPQVAVSAALVARWCSLTLATRLADFAIGGIAEEPPTRAVIDGVRSSLARVGAPGKQAVLDRLARLDRAVKR
jgi:hypothetical protein